MPRGRILLECLVHPGFTHVDMARLPELVTKHLFERQTVRELSDPLGVLVGFAGLARTAVVSLDPSDYFRSEEQPEATLLKGKTLELPLEAARLPAASDRTRGNGYLAEKAATLSPTIGGAPKTDEQSPR